jgi:hypothetical protein
MQIIPGQKLVNNKEPDSDFGTIGGVVSRSGIKLLLTCFHCVFTEGMGWDQRDVPSGLEGIKVDIGGGFQLSAANITDTLRDDRIDGALLSPAPTCLVSEQIPIFGKTQGVGYLNEDDRGRWLRKYGAVTKDTYGQFKGFFPYSNLYKGEARKHQLEKLIMIRTNDGSKFSSKGDSGSFVLNHLNQVVGIIVMGDGDTSYAIQAAILESRLNFQFI